MTSLRLSPLFILLLNLVQVWGTGIGQRTTFAPYSGTDMIFTTIEATIENKGGGYWWQQVLPSTAMTVDDHVLRNAAVAGFNNARWQAMDLSIWSPFVVAALFIPGKGYIVTTDIKGPGRTRQSSQTCTILTDGSQRSYANCAELNALAIALNQRWDIPESGAKLATFGRPFQKMKFLAPSTDTIYNEITGEVAVVGVAEGYQTLVGVLTSAPSVDNVVPLEFERPFNVNEMVICGL